MGDDGGDRFGISFVVFAAELARLVQRPERFFGPPAHAVIVHPLAPGVDVAKVAGVPAGEFEGDAVLESAGGCVFLFGLPAPHFSIGARPVKDLFDRHVVLPEAAQFIPVVVVHGRCRLLEEESPRLGEARLEVRTQSRRPDRYALLVTLSSALMSALALVSATAQRRGRSSPRSRKLACGASRCSLGWPSLRRDAQRAPCRDSPWRARQSRYAI